MNEAVLKVDKLMLFRNAANDAVINNIKRASGDNGERFIVEVFNSLISFGEAYSINGDLWKRYVLHLILKDENIFTAQCEKYGRTVGQSLVNAAAYDLNILYDLFKLDISFVNGQESDSFSGLLKSYVPTAVVKRPGRLDEVYKSVYEVFSKGSSISEIMDCLGEFYHKAGAGMMNEYAAFKWDRSSGLKGIGNVDDVYFCDLIGIERQKSTLMENTERFINGYSANNVLLYGDNGTGKSSCIKALVNEYADRGLRLFELPKGQLQFIPEIYDILGSRGCKYVIFMDDLSFEDDEVEYKYLKALMEGGIQAKPSNVLIYATSNRRHLINEKWADREGSEIHVRDTLQEKTSLSDRFGITIFFESPNQKEYLNIVKGIARRHDIRIPEKELEKMAVQWELSGSGRSGRRAQQFINKLSGQSNR